MKAEHRKAERAGATSEEHHELAVAEDEQRAASETAMRGDQGQKVDALVPEVPAHGANPQTRAAPRGSCRRRRGRARLPTSARA